MTRAEKAEALLKHVERFITDEKITCPETVYQTDSVSEHSYEFIVECCEIAGYWEYPDDEG